MKKFIAISAALALVAGSAFAVDVTWSGEVTVGANLVQGGNDWGDTSQADVTNIGTPVPDGGHRENLLIGRGMNSGGWLAVTFATDTDVGRFQAWTRLNTGQVPAAADAAYLGWRRSNSTIDAHIWWRPMDMFRLGLGHNLGWTGGIGYAGTHRIGGAGVNISRGGIGLGHPFLGTSPHGLSFEITPMDMLNVAITLPYRSVTSRGGTAPNQVVHAPEIADIFRGVFARVWVDLDGIGRIGFGYAGGSQTVEHGDLPWSATSGYTETETDPGRIHAFFSSTQLVPGLGLQFGVGFRLPNSFEMVDRNPAVTNISYSYHSELSFGLGAQYMIMPGLQVRFNATAALALGGEQSPAADGFALGERWDTRASTLENATRLGFDLAVVFEATETIALTLYGGFGMDMVGGDFRPEGAAAAPTTVNTENRVWWAVNPYVTVNFASGPRFLAGVQVWGNSGDLFASTATPPTDHWYRSRSTMNWAIPIGMTFSF